MQAKQSQKERKTMHFALKFGGIQQFGAYSNFQLHTGQFTLKLKKPH
jgi:hypothetical protein